jgi:DNA invertase Pin-like site-specific DNA recombinase
MSQRNPSAGKTLAPLRWPRSAADLGRLIFGIFAALAEFERELIRERTKAWIAAAKRRGRHVGRPRKLTAHQLAHTRALIEDGTEKGEMAALLGVGKATLRRALKA